MQLTAHDRVCRLSAQAWLFVGLALSLATWGINRIRQQSSLATDGGQQADMRREQQRQVGQALPSDVMSCPVSSSMLLATEACLRIEFGIAGREHVA